MTDHDDGKDIGHVPFDHEQFEARDNEATDLRGEPTGRTVDGEVLPIVLDIGTKQAETPDNAIALALAAHFGVEPEALTGFVVSVEYATEEGITLSSVWSLGVPAWRLRAFADELSKHLAQV